MERRQRLSEAAESYAAALNLQPKNEDLKQKLAATLEEAGDAAFKEKRFGETVRHYRRLIDVRSHSPRALAPLGISLFHEGDYPGALGMLERALQTSPDHISTLAYRALTLRALNQPFAMVLERILSVPGEGFWDTTTKNVGGADAGRLKAGVFVQT